ncbi:hypothetical protein [Actinacidiphila glaucinigra]|uniref:hypothetical protein n=1 Tax=Actinacidiphila glaucinigra TaxID=235986 RepID=UPI0029B814E3|nr:hypothetical protein [Streptomyces sp. PA03-3a]
MKDSREHGDWMDASLAERLLDGAPVGDADGRAARVAGLLAVASAPSAADPARERLVLAAYRQARDAGTTRRRRSGLGRRARVVAGGLAAVFALGGVAVAAQTGTLPNPFHSTTTTPRPVTSGSAGSVAPVSSASPGSVAPTPTASVSTSPTAPTASRTSGAHPVPPGSPGVPPGLTEAEPRGLCQAYVKAAGRGEAMDAAARAMLERVAGGKDALGPYCDRLLGPGAAQRSQAPAPPTENGGHR